MPLANGFSRTKNLGRSRGVAVNLPALAEAADDAEEGRRVVLSSGHKQRHVRDGLEDVSIEKWDGVLGPEPDPPAGDHQIRLKATGRGEGDAGRVAGASFLAKGGRAATAETEHDNDQEGVEADLPEWLQPETGGTGLPVLFSTPRGSSHPARPPSVSPAW